MLALQVRPDRGYSVTVHSSACRRWTPFGWAWASFPHPNPECEEAEMDECVSLLIGRLDLTTEQDSSALGETLHAAHLLRSRQGADGLWPARIQLRTAAELCAGRTDSPVLFLRRLGEALKSSEFDVVFGVAEEGTIDHAAERSAVRPN